MLPEKFREKHDIYLDGWMRAEEVLKITERIKNETFIPSIKELRYASRRVVQAHLESTNGKASDEDIFVHLTEAIENCRKARHDAIDSAINYVHEQLDKLSEQVGLATLSKAFPRYSELRGMIRAIDERIIASRKDRCALDDEYETIKRDHLGRVVDFYYELESSEEVIRDIQKKEKKDFIAAVIVGGLAIGIIVTIIGTVAEKRGYFDWASSAHTTQQAKNSSLSSEKPNTPPEATPKK